MPQPKRPKKALKQKPDLVRIAVYLVGFAIIGLITLKFSHALTTAGPPPVPISGAYIGTSARTNTHIAQPAACASVASQRELVKLECRLKAIGGAPDTFRFNIEHFYMLNAECGTVTRFQSGGDIYKSAADNRYPLVNIDCGTWGDVIAGKSDANIVKLANAVKTLNKPIFIAYNHEPDGVEGKQGDPCQYAPAYRRFVDKFRSVSGAATRVSFVLIMTNYTFDVPNYSTCNQRNPDIYYAGDNYVDWLAIDPYNFYNPTDSTAAHVPATPGWVPYDQSDHGHLQNNWVELRDHIQNFYNWSTLTPPAGCNCAKRPTKPLMISEFGVSEDPALAALAPQGADQFGVHKAQWFDNLRHDIDYGAWPKIHAFVYFHAPGIITTYVDTPCPSSYTGWPNNSGQATPCGGTVWTTSPTALQGFGRFVSSKYFIPQF